MKLTSIAIVGAIAVLTVTPEVYAQTLPQTIAPQNSAVTFLTQGLQKSDLGDLQGALADYTQAIRINPRYSLAYYNRGIVYQDLGETEAALVDYGKAIEINQNWGKGGLVDAYINRGLLRDQQGDRKGAISDYDQAIHLNPRDSEAYYNRGIVYYNMGEKKAALVDYTKAIQVNKWTEKGPHSAYLNRGNVKAQLGDRKGAFEDYSKAINLKSDYALAYKNRGILYLGTGQKTEGIQNLEKAADLFQQQGNFTQYEQVMQILSQI
ncbi:MAG: tetratricopeptide repeat protein [Scytonema sp. PMC 1069.18]|nr:tetratricopeptide repeat protein [Scytonema sp. PMC 1069.18]MEC4887871.1 tetratricopeptide repeat protein [Scytonema sp. PMC 1070.18]